MEENNPNPVPPPRIRTKDAIRARLSSHWFQAALKHSKKSPSDLKVIYEKGLSDGTPKADVEAKTEADAKKKKKTGKKTEKSNSHVFERYATGERSMHIDKLPKFIKIMRSNEALPPRASGLITPEEWIIRREHPSKTIDELREISGKWEKKKEALEIALSDYIDCIKQADNLQAVIVDTKSAIEDEICGDTFMTAREVFWKDLAKILESVQGHEIISPKNCLIE